MWCVLLSRFAEDEDKRFSFLEMMRISHKSLNGIKVRHVVLSMFLMCYLSYCDILLPIDWAKFTCGGRFSDFLKILTVLLQNSLTSTDLIWKHLSYLNFISIWHFCAVMSDTGMSFWRNVWLQTVFRGKEDRVTSLNLRKEHQKNCYYAHPFEGTPQHVFIPLLVKSTVCV